MLRNVVVIVPDGVSPFELSVLCETFGLDRTADGLPRYEFDLCAVRPGPVQTRAGFSLNVRHGLERVESADLVAVPGVQTIPETTTEVLDALRASVDRGARVLSVCVGAFALGAAGLLDGRRCTTHWMHAERLAALYPRALVDPDVLYVDEGQVLTSAGTAAGIDLCLHVIRAELGAAVAGRLARRMVVPPHRDGGQAQYIETPMPPSRDGTLAPVLAWMASNLHEELTVESLAAKAHMSTRTFWRRFRAETGTTPYHWLIGQRILLAQRLLEETDETVDLIADRSGFGSAPTLRHHFTRWRGTTPHSYRRTFRAEETAPLAVARSA